MQNACLCHANCAYRRQKVTECIGVRFVVRPVSPTVSRRELANTLRQLRRRAGRTLEEAAAALEVSAATLSRLETGVRVPRARDVRDLCEFYGVTDRARVEALTSLVADAKEPGWWESYTEVDDDYATYIGFEAAATAIDQFKDSLIPGSLQTVDYGRAYLQLAARRGRKQPPSDHDIEKRVEVRIRRQQQLFATDPDVRYTAIIDEAALLRPVGGATVMRKLSQLLLAAVRPNAEILMLPLANRRHPGREGGFTVSSLLQAQVFHALHIEFLAGQLFLESPDELDRHRRVFAILRHASLDATASQEALRRIMADFSVQT
jgi:transcriptional regulator with XRE-family HTH domain